jgi:Uma2 family endonuclease
MSVAEAVPDLRGARVPLDEPVYEILNGEIVELPPMSFHANKIASRLLGLIWPFANGRQLGEVVSEVLVRLPLEHDRHRNRRPDLAFVSYERWPRGKPESYRENAWDVVPDLAVEVVSPNDFADELMEKTSEYFQAGVRLVWHVYPRQRLIQIYESLYSIRIVGADGILDGGVVLPGLSVPLADVFISDPTDEPGPTPSE